jgi:acetyl esterase/lipase
MDAKTHLDPEVAAALQGALSTMMDFGSLEFSGLPALREAMATMARPPLPPTTTVYEDHTVPGRDGHPDVTVRVYRSPGTPTPAPVVYWIHGGGYMFGTALTEDARLNRWAEELGCVVVSVEYRLAPEDPYPAPLEDCYTGLLWTAAHAGELGIDPGRVVIAGASAGGGLAAGLALLARDRGEVAVAYQLLIYPMIDDRNVTGSSHIETVVWTRSANHLGWRAYLGTAGGEGGPPAYAAPSRATDLSGLPPAYIGVGTLDVFRDEDVDYAMRLLAADVETELHVYAGAPHGFEMMAPQSVVARRCQQDIDAALRRALHPPQP